MGMELVAGAMRCLCENGGGGPAMTVDCGFQSSGVNNKAMMVEYL